MRTLKHAITTAAIVFGLIAAAQAGDADQATAPEKQMEMKNQTHCPVMGGKIDSTVYTDIQGQRVYHCCPMCSDKLKADPDKYFKKAAEEGVIFENIQTTCPVSGEKLGDSAVFTDYEGRRVMFCCQKCVGTFKEDPAKYLKKLDEAAETDEQDMKMMKEMEHGDHSGHDH